MPNFWKILKSKPLTLAKRKNKIRCLFCLLNTGINHTTHKNFFNNFSLITVIHAYSLRSESVFITVIFYFILKFLYVVVWLTPVFFLVRLLGKKYKSNYHAPPGVRVTVACAAAPTYRQVQSFHKTSKSTDYANQYVLRGG